MDCMSKDMVGDERSNALDSSRTLSSVEVAKAWKTIAGDALKGSFGGGHVPAPHLQEAELFDLASAFYKSSNSSFIGRIRKQVYYCLGHIKRALRQDSYCEGGLYNILNENISYPSETTRCFDQLKRYDVRLTITNPYVRRLATKNDPTNVFVDFNCAPELRGVNTVYLITEVVYASSLRLTVDVDGFSKVYHENQTPVGFAYSKFNLLSSGKMGSKVKSRLSTKMMNFNISRRNNRTHQHSTGRFSTGLPASNTHSTMCVRDQPPLLVQQLSDEVERLASSRSVCSHSPIKTFACDNENENLSRKMLRADELWDVSVFARNQVNSNIWSRRLLELSSEYTPNNETRTGKSTAAPVKFGSYNEICRINNHANRSSFRPKMVLTPLVGSMVARGDVADRIGRLSGSVAFIEHVGYDGAYATGSLRAGSRPVSMMTRAGVERRSFDDASSSLMVARFNNNTRPACSSTSVCTKPQSKMHSVPDVTAGCVVGSQDFSGCEEVGNVSEQFTATLKDIAKWKQEEATRLDVGATTRRGSYIETTL